MKASNRATLAGGDECGSRSGTLALRWRGIAGASLTSLALLLGPAFSASAQPSAGARKPGATKPATLGSSATFKPTTLEISNPERGWYAFGEDLSVTTNNRLRQLYGEGFRMVFATINLWEYRVSPIPPEFMSQIERGFDAYRGNGMKVLLRVVYNYEAGSPDAPLSVVLLHLNQLKPLLAANSDVIAYMQGGLVGAWGEWHSSTNDLTQPAAKAAIREALLAVVPPPLYVQFRFPRDVMAWVPKPLDATTAFQATAQARTANHNDCFMSSPNDVGTYNGGDAAVEAAQREYVKATTEFSPYGGETCSGFGPTRQTCADILREGAAYHVTYLNRRFYPAFHNQWKSEGCFDEVARQMGYRFQLDAVNHAPSVVAGNDLAVSIDLRNTGWSRIFSPRRLVVALRNAQSGDWVEGRGDTDLRTLPTQAKASTRATVNVAVPVGTPAGSYTVWVGMPDINVKTMKDSRYAVRFANDEDAGKGQQWDESTGRFGSGTAVTVR